MTKMLLLLEDFVGLGGGGAVGAFGDDACTRWLMLLDGLAVDLAFEGGRDEHVDVLGDPGVAVFDDVAGLRGPCSCRWCRTGR